MIRKSLRLGVAVAKSAMAAATGVQSMYEFTGIKDIKGQLFDMGQLRGKVTLVMNVASQCGYTNTGYTTATTLYNKYKEQGFMVIGFPCNQFGGQEPGTADQIHEFACTRYKAEFPLMEKVEVNGKNAHPLWEFLKTKKPGIFGTTGIKWNFTMFLVDRNGQPVERYAPGAKPGDIEPLLTQLLNTPS